MVDEPSLQRLAWNLKPLMPMSKDNNVNPGQYKVGGRLRQDDKARVDEERAKASEAEQRSQDETYRPKKKEE